MSRTDLSCRMKESYERSTRIHLPRRSYVLVRADGKAFHSYTRGLDRPYDNSLHSSMTFATKFACEQMQNVKFAYTQSDEISFLMADFDEITTQAWFDNNLQKICSVTASLVTAGFNSCAQTQSKLKDRGPAVFDARVWIIPDPVEVENYFIWRQNDASRNSISMAAQSMYSHKELMNKSQSDMHEMMFAKGTNWNDYPVPHKRGVAIYRGDKGFETDLNIPIFVQDREFLRKHIPVITRDAPI